MKKVSGMVLEVGHQDCTVLGPGNHYVKLRIGEARPQIGEIFEGYPLHTLSQRPVSRIWAYVASILITLVLGTYQVYALTLAPAAYVSLDAASSIELVLNSQGKVIKTNVFNTPSAEILKHSPVDNLAVNAAIKSILPALVSDSTASTAKVVVITYSDSPAISGTDLTQTAAGVLQQSNYRGQLITDLVNTDYRNQANHFQMSAGQKLVFDLAKWENTPLDLNVLHKEGLDPLIAEQKLDLNNLLEITTLNSLAPPVITQIEPPVSKPTLPSGLKQASIAQPHSTSSTVPKQAAAIQPTKVVQQADTQAVNLPIVSAQPLLPANPPDTIKVSQVPPPPTVSTGSSDSNTEPVQTGQADQTPGPPLPTPHTPPAKSNKDHDKDPGPTSSNGSDKPKGHGRDNAHGTPPGHMQNGADPKTI